MRSRNDEFKYLYRRTVKGREYVYFRRPNVRELIPLPQPVGSPEFRRAHAVCIKAVAPTQPIAESSRPVARVRFEPDTVGAGMLIYFASSKFARLKPKSQYVYRKALDVLRGYLGDVAFRDLDVDKVDLYSEMVAQLRSPSTADAHVALLSLLWQVCRKHPQFQLKGRANPTRGAKKRYTVKASDKHREATPSCIARSKSA